MYLKYLSIRGFKSFADTAKVKFSPGLTVIVGPNGSGKSNVVDALAWVLGAQGPKQLRSSKMEDVIFAGSSGRPPLGRAEVSVTFDNSDESLSVPLSEVSISRSLYRSGESSYKLNEVACRLSDLVDLLGEVGVGKSQHLIISQGEVDDIVNAKADDLRVIIEEAAGITRHKRRRDQALKRLVEVDGDLEDISKMERDLKRKIKPLEKQYELARMRDELIGRKRSLSLWIASMEMKELSIAETTLKSAKAALEVKAVETSEALAKSARDLSELKRLDESAALAQLEALDGEIQSLESEIKGKSSVLRERIRSIEGRVLQLNAELDLSRIQRLRKSKAELEAKVAAEGKELVDKEQRLKDRVESVVEPPREELETYEREVDLLRASVHEKRSDLEGLKRRLVQEKNDQKQRHQALEELAKKMRELSADSESLRRSILETQTKVSVKRQDAETLKLDADALEDELSSLRQLAQGVKEELSSIDAELSALRTFQGGRQSRAALQVDFVTLLDLYKVPEGYEFALEAALGDLGRAFVVSSEQDLRAGYLALCDAGSSGVIVTEGFLEGISSKRSSDAFVGNRPKELLVSNVEAKETGVSKEALMALLEDVFMVDDDQEAASLLAERPHARFVTRQGHVFSLGRTEVSIRGDRAIELRTLHLQQRRKEWDQRYKELQEKIARVDTRLTSTLREHRSMVVEIERLVETQTAHHRKLQVVEDRFQLIEKDKERLTLQLEGAGLTLSEEDLTEKERDLTETLRALAHKEASLSDARLQRREFEARQRALETLKNEIRLKAVEVESYVKMLRQIEADLSEETRLYEDAMAASKKERTFLDNRLKEARTYRNALEHFLMELLELGDEVRSRLGLIREAISRRAKERATLESTRQSLEAQLQSTREESRSLDEEISKVSLTMRLKEESFSRYLGASMAQVLSARPVEGVAPTLAKDELESVERRLSEIGPVNAYAALELEALRAELKEVEANSSDVRATRREMRSLLSAIDDEMRISFADTFSQIQRNFTRLFEKLFPGGKGSLRLETDKDVLEAQVDFDIEIPGKKVTRLSLLSGGERSLVGLAFLFSIFETKPTPFVVLDEVEAALDDRNLTSFIELLKEFRSRVQIIVVTHQKRTMETADVLVGVSSTQKGSSQIIREEVSRYESELV
jgi:chromosome segregation protein